MDSAIGRLQRRYWHHFLSDGIQFTETAVPTIQTNIDFITKLPDGGCKLVLVEVGPWSDEEKDQNLQRLGQRICDCVTAVLNGIVAERYPDTRGRSITIQVDSYDTPRLEVDILVAKLQNSFNASEDIQQQLREARYTPSFRLTHHWADSKAELAKREATQIRRLWQRLKHWAFR